MTGKHVRLLRVGTLRLPAQRIRVGNLCEKKSVARDRLPGLSAFFHLHDFRYPFRRAFAVADLQKRAYYRPYHVSEKTVGPYCKEIPVLFYLLPACFHYVADRGLVPPVYLFKAAEIVDSQQVSGGPVHGRNIRICLCKT